MFSFLKIMLSNIIYQKLKQLKSFKKVWVKCNNSKKIPWYYLESTRKSITPSRLYLVRKKSLSPKKFIILKISDFIWNFIAFYKVFFEN
jgi:hypothetical protein